MVECDRVTVQSKKQRGKFMKSTLATLLILLAIILAGRTVNAQTHRTKARHHAAKAARKLADFRSIPEYQSSRRAQICNVIRRDSAEYRCWCY
jgi:hypothetical protein